MNAPLLSALPALPTRGAPITADDVQRIEAIVAERVNLVDDVQVLREWQAQAAALEAYLRSKDLQRPMLGAQRRVEARIGQLLGADIREVENSGHDLSSIESGLRQDCRILARAFNCLSDDDEWRKSRRALVALVRQRCGLIPDTPPLPVGQFRCIVADPPWKLDTGPTVFNGTGESGHDALAYEQMSLDAITSLPVEQRAAPDAHLYLWTTNRYVENAYDVARAWGFKPSVLLVWCKKPRGIGLGDAYRLTTEFILYARRGKLKETAIIESTWFEWPRGKHSAKPKAFYEMAERMTPVKDASERLEMFARGSRDGWSVWGHEAE
jgi:N6-adenosine-specific RNA methylase IME4